MIDLFSSIYLEVRLHMADAEPDGFGALMMAMAPWVSPLIAFLLGLFSTRLARLVNRPKLSIALVSREGAVTNVGAGQGSTRRYFHLRAENQTRFVGIHEVQVCLLDAIVELDGHAAVHGYAGPTPLPWRHNLGGGDGTNPRTLGAEVEADIFNLSDFDIAIAGNAPFAMPSLISTPDGPWASGAETRAKFQKTMRLRLFAQARGVEADSKVIEIDVEWDWTNWKQSDPIPAMSIEVRYHDAIPSKIKNDRELSAPKQLPTTGRLYWGGQERPDAV